MNAITNGILPNVSLPKETIDFLNSQLTDKTFSKGEMIQQKGDKNKNSFFVKKGILRSYSIDEKGKEHIFSFAPEGWIISDIQNQGKNSKLYIDAIEDTEVSVFNEDFFRMIHDDYPDIFSQSIEKLVKRIGVLQNRILMLMSATALERYQDFCSTYPDIVQRVPQKMIASYLGITPEALSKIRASHLKKQ